MFRHIVVLMCVSPILVFATEKATLVILGAGPAGLAAAQYAANDGIDTLVISGPVVGGLITQTQEIENYPGVKRTSTAVLANTMLDQARDAGARILEDSAASIDLRQRPFKVTTVSGLSIEAEALIYAMGSTPNTLLVPGEELYVGAGISPCATCDARFFKNKDVAVVGGGDSAIEEALQLAHHVKSVTIFVRSDRMRAAHHSQQKIRNHKKISLVFNHSITSVYGNGTSLTGLVVRDNQKNKSKKVPMQGLFLAIGHRPNTELVKDQLALADDGHIIIDERTRMASINGVFTAGDVSDSRYRQAITAAAQGVQAAMNVRWWLIEAGMYG